MHWGKTNELTKTALVQVLRSPFSVLRSPFSVLRSPFSLICASALLLAATDAAVQAANITINSPRSEGVNPPRSTGSDTIIITESGGITTTGNGIETNNDGSTITNRGRIEVEGAEAVGIEANSNNMITNLGDIITTGPEGYGIEALNGNTIINRGNITTSGDPSAEGTADGIYGDNRNKITNSGSIRTSGRGANGIQVVNNNTITITTSGSINVTGPDAAGIQAGTGNELELEGSVISTQGSALVLGDNNAVNHRGSETLRSTGENTPAVRLGSNNRFSNWGRIEATGTGAEAHAITGDSGNTISNDGVIQANPAGGGKAIRFTGRNNTLNLGPNSRIIGDIDLGVGGRQNQVAEIDDANQIKVSQAPAVSVLWDGITARPAKGSEGAPFFYNAQSRQLATYDPRALAAAAGVLGDASGNVSGLMARPALQPAGNARNLNQMATGSALWLRSFGSRARYHGRGDLNPESGHLGLAAGYELRLNATRLGMLAGYGRGELNFEGTQRFRPGPSLFKGPFAGLYVRRDFAPFWAQLGLSGGALRHASSRLVNDNRAPNGLARAGARTRSWWLAPEARIGLRLDAGLMQFEPSFTARYARQSIRGFTETGIRAPATLARRTVELVETRLELKAGRDVGPGRIALRAGWQYRDDLNSNQVQVRLLGESQRVRLESGLGGSLYLGAEAEFELLPDLFLNLSGEAVSGDGYRNVSGMASVYQAF